MNSFKLFNIFLFLCFIATACKEDNSTPSPVVLPITNPTDPEYLIEVIQGNNQSGLANTALKDSIIIRIIDKESQKGISKVPILVKFKVCEKDTIINLITNNIGIISHSWETNFLVGKQALKFVAKFPNSKSDSVTLNSNISENKEWHPCACLGGIFTTLTAYHNSINNNLFVTTDWSTSDGSFHNSVNISKNNGLSFKPILSGLYKDVRFGNIYESKNNEIFVDSGKGLYFSIDEGKTWNIRKAPANGNMQFLADDAFITNKIQSEYFVSNDKGITWKNIQFECITSNCTDIEKIHKLSNGKLITWTSTGGIFESIDKGNSWKKINKFNDFSSLATNSKGEIYITTPSVYISRNEGKTFEKLFDLKEPENNRADLSIEFDIVKIYYDKSILISRDGIKFSEFSKPSFITNTADYQLILTSNNSAIIPIPFSLIDKKLFGGSGLVYKPNIF